MELKEANARPECLATLARLKHNLDNVQVSGSCYMLDGKELLFLCGPEQQQEEKQYFEQSGNT